VQEWAKVADAEKHFIRQSRTFPGKESRKSLLLLLLLLLLLHPLLLLLLLLRLFSLFLLSFVSVFCSFYFSNFSFQIFFPNG